MSFAVVPCGEYHVTLWLHTDRDPPPDEWALALQRVATLKQRLGGISNLRALVLTDGGAPNALQRGELNDILEGTAKSAVVSNVLSHRLKRGIATAISWLNPNFRAFPPDQFDQALAHLDLTGHRVGILAALQRLQTAESTETMKLLLGKP